MLDDLSECILVDGFSRSDRNDIDATFAGPVNDASSSYWQAPIAFKFLFQRFPADWVFNNVGQRGSHLALELRMESPNETTNFSRNFESATRHLKRQSVNSSSRV